MKQIIIILLATALISGCGGGDNSSSTQLDVSGRYYTVLEGMGMIILELSQTDSLVQFTGSINDFSFSGMGSFNSDTTYLCLKVVVISQSRLT